MAPKSGEPTIAEDKDYSLNNDNLLQANETGEIWSSILQEVASSKNVPTKNLLILGDGESGKSTLIRHLKGEEDEEVFEAPNANGTMSKSIGTGTDDLSSNDKRSNNDLALSYTYIEVKDEEDTLARLGIHQLAGSYESYQSLLRFALNSSTLPHSLVVIVLDWARPWTFIETLQRWIKFVELGIQGVKTEGSIGSKDGWTKGNAVVEELKESLQRFIQNYSEPDSTNPNATVNSENDDDVALPLGSGVLTTNLAVPLVVVCTKSDHVGNLERELDYKEEQFDYIQQTLRTICLKYGAALFYTTVRQPQTFTQLRQYLLHRLLSPKSSSSDTKSAYPFNIKAHVVERDTVLVPTGWDSWGKIKVLRDGYDCDGTLQGWDLDMGITSTTPDEGANEIISVKKLYEDVAVHEDSDKPLSAPRMIVAEDEQDFFQRHYDTLQKANSERQSPPSVVGPMGAPSYPYGDIGADIPDLDSTPLNNPVSSRPKVTATAKVPSPPSGLTSPNGNPSVPANGLAPNQNEVLANFFQNLLSKKNVAPASSSGTSQASSNEPTTSPVISKKTNGTNNGVPSRMMVEKELDKLRNMPNSTTTSMAGK